IVRSPPHRSPLCACSLVASREAAGRHYVKRAGGETKPPEPLAPRQAVAGSPRASALARAPQSIEEVLSRAEPVSHRQDCRNGAAPFLSARALGNLDRRNG